MPSDSASARLVDASHSDSHELARVAPRQTILLLFFALVLASGVAGLGYQMVWTRMLAVALGHEIIAVLAVISAFFCGLALGGWLLNQRLLATAKPGHWYVALELGIAAWSVALIALLPLFNQWLPQWLGAEPSPLRHWGLAFGATFLLLSPATIAMGATLPALEALVARRWALPGRIPTVYAANTLGAVLGTLLVTFWAIPGFGLNATLFGLALGNLLCAAAAGLCLRARVKPKWTLATHTPHATWQAPRGLLWSLALTGFIGIGFEVLVFRVLSQALENTVYSYAAMLAAYLLGTSLGAALYQALKAHASLTLARWLKWRTILSTVCAISCVAGAMVLFGVPSIYFAVIQLLGLQPATALAAELTAAASVLLLPTVAMGALFAHLLSPAVQRIGLGKALAVNTLACAGAPIAFGLVLLPQLGSKWCIVICALGYLLVPYIYGGRQQPLTLKLSPAAVAVAALCLMLVLPPLRILQVPAGAEVLHYQDGVVASVAVTEGREGDRHLKVNNHFTMGGTASRMSDHRQTHLPFLLHGNLLSPTPRQALYLGVGTGITLQAAKYYNTVHATGVELVPEMLALLPYFGVSPAGREWSQPATLISADARRYVLATAQTYDVIIAEIFHPSRDGAGSLYTVEHFQAVRDRLAADGVFAQWLPLFQLDLPTLKAIVASFIRVFPEAQLHLGHFSLQQPILCLLGRNQAHAYSENWLLERVFAKPLQQQLVAGRLNSDLALFGGYLANREALQRFVQQSPLNTDDKPLVNYRAPGFVYREEEPASVRVQALLNAFAPEASEFLAANTSAEFSARLNAYWQARQLFLATGIAGLNEPDTTTMLLNSRAGLLASLRASADFEPAYRALLGSAHALYPTHSALALELLRQVEAIAPQFNEARQLREALRTP